MSYQNQILENYITEPGGRSQKIVELSNILKELSVSDQKDLIWQAPVPKRDELTTELNEHIFAPV